MSSISSLEVYRTVLLEPGETFVQDVASIGRQIFDLKGCSAVSIGPDNETIRTVVNGASYFGEDRLNFYHLSIAGLNVRKFGGAIVRSRDRLEKGTIAKIAPNATVEQRSGVEPLDDTLAFIMKKEFCQDEDEIIHVVLDRIEEVEYSLLYPGKKIFVLRASPQSNRFESRMLERMSAVTRIALESAGSKVAQVPDGEIVNAVPIAETRFGSEAQSRDFMKHIKDQLLPIEASLASIAFNTKY